MKATEIAKFLGVPLCGADVEVTSLSGLDQPVQGSVTFSKSPLVETSALPSPILLILPSEGEPPVNVASVQVPDPRTSFALVAHEFFVVQRVPGGQSALASIHPSAQVHETATIDPFAVVSEGCKVGANAWLASGVYLGPNCTVGLNSIIGPNTCVGHLGFGFATDGDGNPFRLPHTGGVRIGDNVEIGSVTTIVSGTINPTVVRDYAKIDDHVHIAHNCDIGERAFVIACAEVSGSVEVGEDAWIAPNSSIRNGLTVGGGAVVGLGAVVVKSVGVGETVAGNPARPIKKRS